ncbi:MAG: type II secretion system protein GspG [Planctomycetes bacterium]|nr:type II secretion system protein GspG [Planctomycetota bacterium]
MQTKYAFLTEIWGNDLIYQSPGEHNEKKFDLSSAGPDGIAGNVDDIVNWKR